MRELFELINEYPWTTFFVFMMALALCNTLSTNIRELLNKK